MAKEIIKTGTLADDILQELKQVRKNLDYVSAVMHILELSNYKIRNSISLTAAKRFLIELVSTTPISPQQELKKQIVLMSFALLDDKDIVWSSRVAKRHQQYVEAYNFKGLTGNSKDPADLNHTEDSIYKIIAAYYVKSLIKNRQFFLNAFNGTLPDGMVVNAPVPINNLPMRPNDFIGREEYLEKLHQNFIGSSGSSRNIGSSSGSSISDEETGTADCIIQILHGMGGIGKTEIAKQYAYAHIGEYKALVWLDFTDDNTLMASTKEFLMRRNPEQVITSNEQARHLLLNYLARLSQFLLVLDNVDYLDEDKEKEAALINRLKSYLPNRGAHIIITTRCNSEFMGATRHKVTSFSATETYTFFTSSIADRIKDEEDEAVVDEMLETAGGLPLVLKLFSRLIRERGFNYLKLKSLSNGVDYLEHSTIMKPLSEVFATSAKKLAGDTAELALARELLFHCAFLGAKYLPLDIYRDVIDKMNRAGIDIPVIEGLSRSDSDNTDGSDNTGSGDNTDGSDNTDDDKLISDAVTILVKHSIVSCDYRSIYLHPVIAALVRKCSTVDKDRALRLQTYANQILALVYAKYGDDDLSDQYYISSTIDNLDDDEEFVPEWFSKVAAALFDDENT